MTAHRIETRILDALKTGQMHKRMLCLALDTGYEHIDKTMSRLLRQQKIEVLGTAREAGYTDVNATVPVYGLAGTKLVKVSRKRRRTDSGSGVIAGKIERGRGSAWIEEPE